MRQKGKGELYLRNVGSDLPEASADKSLEGLETRFFQFVVALGRRDETHDEREHCGEIGAHSLACLTTGGRERERQREGEREREREREREGKIPLFNGVLH